MAATDPTPRAAAVFVVVAVVVLAAVRKAFGGVSVSAGATV